MSDPVRPSTSPAYSTTLIPANTSKVIIGLLGWETTGDSSGWKRNHTHT